MSYGSSSIENKQMDVIRTLRPNKKGLALDELAKQTTEFSDIKSLQRCLHILMGHMTVVYVCVGSQARYCLLEDEAECKDQMQELYGHEEKKKESEAMEPTVKTEIVLRPVEPVLQQAQLDRMQEALDSPSTLIPPDLSLDETRGFITDSVSVNRVHRLSAPFAVPPVVKKFEVPTPKPEGAVVPKPPIKDHDGRKNNRGIKKEEMNVTSRLAKLLGSNSATARVCLVIYTHALDQWMTRGRIDEICAGMEYPVSRVDVGRVLAQNGGGNPAFAQYFERQQGSFGHFEYRWNMARGVLPKDEALPVISLGQSNAVDTGGTASPKPARIPAPYQPMKIIAAPAHVPAPEQQGQFLASLSTDGRMTISKGGQVIVLETNDVSQLRGLFNWREYVRKD